VKRCASAPKKSASIIESTVGTTTENTIRATAEAVMAGKTATDTPEEEEYAGELGERSSSNSL
jgi:hypothetical protein